MISLINLFSYRNDSSIHLRARRARPRSFQRDLNQRIGRPVRRTASRKFFACARKLNPHFHFHGRAFTRGPVASRARSRVPSVPKEHDRRAIVRTGRTVDSKLRPVTVLNHSDTDPGTLASVFQMLNASRYRSRLRRRVSHHPLSDMARDSEYPPQLRRHRSRDNNAMRHSATTGSRQFSHHLKSVQSSPCGAWSGRDLPRLPWKIGPPWPAHASTSPVLFAPKISSFARPIVRTQPLCVPTPDTPCRGARAFQGQLTPSPDDAPRAFRGRRASPPERMPVAG